MIDEEKRKGGGEGSVKKCWIISISAWIPTLPPENAKDLEDRAKRGRRGRRTLIHWKLPTANKRYIEFTFSA